MKRNLSLEYKILMSSEFITILSLIITSEIKKLCFITSKDFTNCKIKILFK